MANIQKIQADLLDAKRCVKSIVETVRYAPNADDVATIRAARETLATLRASLQPMEAPGYVLAEVNRRTRELAEESIKNPAGIATSTPRDITKEVESEMHFRLDQEHVVRGEICQRLREPGARVLKGFVEAAQRLYDDQIRFETSLAEKFGAKFVESNTCACISRVIETAQKNLDGIEKGCDPATFAGYL